MKYLYLILLSLLLLGGKVEAVEKKTSVENVLQDLDEALLHKKKFHAAKELRIAKIKKDLQAATDFNVRDAIYRDIYTEYLHYQTDSALYYVNKRGEELLKNNYLPGQQYEVILGRAEIMAIMGMYNESLEELQKIRPESLTGDILLSYYRTLRGYYGWLTDYTVAEAAKKKYIEKTNAYRDSILLNSPKGMNYDIAYAEKCIGDGRPDSAFHCLEKYIGKTPDIKQSAYIYYTLAEACQAMGNVDRQIYYLAKTALLDLRMAEREYASLQKLARLVFQKNDLVRAYRYLNCSMEDAVNCNARLRFMEVTEYYPIIDKAYTAKELQERRNTQRMLVIVSLLAFLLIVLAAYLYYWMKKISVVRSHLYEANRKLVSANADLAKTGKIMEVYIAQYLDRCVMYLDKLEQYRRSLEKLAMASKIEDLFKAIRSEQFLRDERKAFYMEFDKSFLDLFPNFISDFNNLLTEEGRIYPKSGELLNTELRIFAMIRLGVTDATRIAHFLGYSLATVYNYRSKIRNKALRDKDRFEQEVMNL